MMDFLVLMLPAEFSELLLRVAEGVPAPGVVAVEVFVLLL